MDDLHKQTTEHLLVLLSVVVTFSYSEVNRRKIEKEIIEIISNRIK